MCSSLSLSLSSQWRKFVQLSRINFGYGPKCIRLFPAQGTLTGILERESNLSPAIIEVLVSIARRTLYRQWLGEHPI